ncbi:VanZ family protein [Flexithrix dorotheae]|uniref:VanZ family protein n=1 Tax=Flexithrix dorotheae TaxID=70993 RepID=UPI00035F1732|nr:VanZ family protein [Flexithrix dorotheae]
MPSFTSSREKKLWLWALAVLAIIFSTLFLGQPLAKLFADQNVRAVIFSFGMILVGMAILFHAIKTRPGRVELAMIFGIVAVYTMLILRLGMPERSHLFEYSVLAILIHKALLERSNQGEKLQYPHLLACVISFLAGVLDECIQIIIPDRVFAPEDIFFNGFVILTAIGFHVILNWGRRRFGRKSIE